MDKIYIIFDVNGQRLKRNNPNLITVGGSYGLVKAKFNLPLLSAWTYCDSIVASFKSESFGPISYTIDSVTNECFVPQEVLKERWFDVTLSGYEGTEIKITSTSVRNDYLGRFEDTPTIPEEPIPDVYAQFLRDILIKGDRVVFENGFLSLYSGEVELSKTPIAGGGEASQIQLRVFDGWIQTSYVSESPVWVNLIALTELQGPAGYTPIKGVDYFDGQKGDPGTPGLKGDPGTTVYTELTDKPVINNVELAGNKSLDDLGIMKKNSGIIVPDAATVSVSLTPGVITKIETLNTCTSLAVTLEAGNWWDEYKIIFTTGAVPPTVSFPISITRWAGGTPTIAANKRYEVSILDGTGVVSSV